MYIYIYIYIYIGLNHSYKLFACVFFLTQMAKSPHDIWRGLGQTLDLRGRRLTDATPPNKRYAVYISIYVYIYVYIYIYIYIYI